MNLLERVEHSIRVRTLFRRGENILVAVSGGLDSMVLLHVLAQLAKDCRWKLVVAHFNHQLRGRSSDADERLVKKTAANLGLEFHFGCGDVKAHALAIGVSVEMAAREMRHIFLAKTARQTRCRVIATAHHADDQVELCFLRLFRGAGGEGLAGMRWKSNSPVDRKSMLARPLLDVEKVTLAEFAKKAGIAFREDASNRSSDMLRNRVRHELLPMLRRRFNPSVDKSVLRLMEIAGAEAQVVASLAEEWLRSNPRNPEFRKCPTAVQRRIIQIQLQRSDVMADFELIETLRLEPSQNVSVGRDNWVRSDRSGLVEKASPPVLTFDAGITTVKLGSSAGKAEFSGTCFSWEYSGGRKFDPGQGVPGVESFDAEKVGGSIVLRHWRAGDRFQPIGMKSGVKLQDWFTNQKIPAARRRELIVATTERGEVFWVEGLRIGERFKLGKQTRRKLIWRWIRQ